MAIAHISPLSCSGAATPLPVDAPLDEVEKKKKKSAKSSSKETSSKTIEGKGAGKVQNLATFGQNITSVP